MNYLEKLKSINVNAGETKVDLASIPELQSLFNEVAANSAKAEKDKLYNEQNSLKNKIKELETKQQSQQSVQPVDQNLLAFLKDIADKVDKISDYKPQAPMSTDELAKVITNSFNELIPQKLAKIDDFIASQQKEKLAAFKDNVLKEYNLIPEAANLLTGDSVEAIKEMADKLKSVPAMIAKNEPIPSEIPLTVNTENTAMPPAPPTPPPAPPSGGTPPNNGDTALDKVAEMSHSEYEKNREMILGELKAKIAGN